MTYYFDTFTTPLGDFSIAVDETGAIAATAFGGKRELLGRLGNSSLTPDPAKIRAARDQVKQYYSGKRQVFDLRLAPGGTAFQQSVWAALQRIPFGKTYSYGELAKALGRPSAARAVGRANATNPIALIIPCHRVIGADGSLTGFAFGEKIKGQLLAHETKFSALAA